MNLIGFATLLRKELLRFLKVTVQTILTPVVTALLYLLIFRHLLEGEVEVYGGLSYGAFLVPGLVMMSMIQNAFANASSSMIQSKMTGNLVFVLLAPISPGEFFGAFVAAAVARGAMVGAGVLVVSALLTGVSVSHPGWVLVYGALGCSVLGALGLIAGIWAEKFEQLAAFQNFIIIPLSFLSGVFYSIHTLPPPWDSVSQLNPFFYILDGFRFGFVGASDVSPWRSLIISGGFAAAVSATALILLSRGYKLRR
jgi:ABC-2 type transport system permease protein